MKKVFIGIDFSKSFFDVALLSGSPMNSNMVYNQFSNDHSGCIHMIKWISEHTSLSSSHWLFCGEYTGLYCVTASEYLFKSGFSLWLESGLQIKRSLGICRGKTDKIDAERIALYAYRFQDKVCLYHPREDVLSQLKDLQAHRSRLVKAKAILEVASKELIKVKGDSTSIFIRESSLSFISGLTLEIEQIDSKARLLIKQSSSVMSNYSLLMSIKGIGQQNAMAMLILTNNFELFTDPRKFGCYCGVVPFSHSSGSSIREKDKVSTLANRKMKALLAQAARSASIHNPYYREYYRVKKMAGKADKLIINNIKNKLIHLMFAVVRNKKAYDPNYQIQVKQPA